MAELRPTAQNRIQRLQQSGFIGRQREIAVFSENLSSRTGAVRHQVLFSIHGDAGVGKSFLTRQLQRIAQDNGAVTAYTDEVFDDVISAMSAIGRELERSGLRLRSFEKRVNTYYRRRHELESDKQAPDGVVDFVTKSAIAIGLTALHNVPVANLLTPVDPAAAADQVNRARVYLAQKFKNHDVKLLLWPIDELTRIFVANLKRAAGDRPVVLFLDGHNQDRLVTDQWILDLYRANYGAIPDRLLITTAGRRPLSSSLFSELLQVISYFRLEPFSEDEATRFLISRDISDAKITDVILTLSGCLPLWLATLASAHPGGADEISDPASDVVSTFLEWVADPDRSDVAIAAALPRQLNQDVLAPLVPADQASQLFDWLCELPFINRTSAWWKYHEVVRGPMLRLQRDKSPTRWRTHQLTLAKAHEGWAAEIAAGDGETWPNPAWAFHRQEQMYHLLCADPAGNLASALASAVAAAATSSVRARQWADVIADAGRDSGSAMLARHGRRLRADADRADLTDYLTYLIDHATLDGRTRSVALAERGECHLLAGRHDDAIADLTKAVELSPDDTWVVGSRGEAYLAMGRYQEAEADLTRAIDMDRDSEFLASRAEVYRATGFFDQAMSDLAEAAKIDPDDAGIAASLAVTYLAEHRYAEAVAEVNRAVSLGMSEDVISVVRGYAYKAMANFQRAIVDFSRAIDLDSANAGVLVSRAESYRAINAYASAVEDFTRALELRPDDADTIASRGGAYLMSGLNDKAECDFAQALELDPDVARLISIFRAEAADGIAPTSQA
jgi:tetratricopeptide (TPR) repeat protein